MQCPKSSLEERRFKPRRAPIRLLLMAATACIASACGDDSVRPAGSLGRLAFSEADSGRLVVLDVATGRRTELTPPLGAPGGISLQPDGPGVAFASEPDGVNRHVMLGDTETLAMHEVTPFLGTTAPDFTWGPGGWFTFSRSAVVGTGTWLAMNETTEARLVDGEFPPTLLASPIDATFVHGVCTGAVPPGEACPAELVLEDAAGTMRRVIATGFGFNPIAFLDNGASIVVYQELEGATHVVVHDLTSTRPSRDLGAYGLPFWRREHGRGLSDVSPDGAELLTTHGPSQYGADLVVLPLDGGNPRTIASNNVVRAGFTATGAVLWEHTVNHTPESDTPDLEYRLFLTRGGADVELRVGERGCLPADVSVSGQSAAWVCGGRALLFALDEPTLLDEFMDAGGVVGFAPDDAGTLIAHFGASDLWPYTIAFHPRAGSPFDLGRAADGQTDRGYVHSPPFDYEH